MNTQQLVLEYFKKFMSKDLTGLADMFSEDIVLVDWDINVSGRDEVLKVNKKLFENTNSICVTPIRIVSNDSTVAAEIKVEISTEEQDIRLNVVDFIEFKEGKILSVHAFKR